VALLGVFAGLTVWLWPIGLGGRMPVGGDVTQFSIGLMAVLAEALRAGRLPIWNDLWGYGFPGLAESQMGVYYPPHWLLYGLLPLEAAYTTSLVSHTFWAGAGAFWATRRFGVSTAGAALAGFSWAACGFFLIHLPHQWGYTVGSWMPWAWGLTWVVVRGEGTRRTPLLLTLVLTLQILPGHFQLAFCTQVGVIVLSVAAVAAPAQVRAGRLRGMGAVALALLAMVPLAAVQLWPTWRLARLAASQRDYEYLSGFASTPLHLVSYLAPRLFHVSPLWRPVAWDRFRTSPEEHLAYVGLVPLFLALGVLFREFRREPATRVLGILTLVTLGLSLGPYLPGFASLIGVPGFSFFRAPARWGLATELALCLLAGRGFDALRHWTRPGWALARFALITALAPCLVLAVIELALASTVRPGWPAVQRLFSAAVRLIPWPDTGDPAPEFRTWVNEARQLQNERRVRFGLARQGVRDVPSAGLRFSDERGSIYVHELGSAAALVVSLLALAPLASRRRFLEPAMLTLTAFDLWSLTRLRTIDMAPIRPLTQQSRVLARLAEAPRGTRVVETPPMANLDMTAGAAAVLSYRTLDLPALVALTHLTVLPPRHPGLETPVLAALRATGTAIRVLDPLEGRDVGESLRGLPGYTERELVVDPALAGWLYGTAWISGEGRRATTFTLWKPVAKPARAWLVPLTDGDSLTILETAGAEPGTVIRVLEGARPLEAVAPRPERLDVAVAVEGPAAVVVSQLADPQWRARWIGPDGVERPAAVRPVFAGPREHGWQAAVVPGPGRWSLRMEYDARDVAMGQLVSGTSLLALIGLAVMLRGRPPRLLVEST
jgi:hypothetical protein